MGSRFLHLACQLGQFTSLSPRELRHCVHYLEKSRICMMFVIPNNIKKQIW